MKYYLKKCKHQELGSISNGQASRGRYLLVSKNDGVLSMFPALSITQLNDSSVIPIFPLYSNKKVYCNFVYHNSKYAAPSDVTGRNEYRIYLNKELENDQLLFASNDIVIIRSFEITGDDGDTQTIFLLDLLKEHSSTLYTELNQVIENSDIPHGKGGHAVYEGNISFFEDRAKTKIQTIQKAVVAIDETVKFPIEPSKISSIESLFNSVSFRDFVMIGYESKCAVTGMVIRHENLLNLEAAHIKPKSHGGSYLPNNGLALCRDIHWAFDKGFFKLDENFTVIVHDKALSEWLHFYNGKQIHIPENPFFRPSSENLKYHQENVFGLFLTSGRL